MGFEEHLQAITAVVQRNAIWAAPIMFALAFAESLAFISLLIPAWAALVATGAIVTSQGFHIIIPVWIAASSSGCLKTASLEAMPGPSTSTRLSLVTRPRGTVRVGAAPVGKLKSASSDL